MFDSPVLVGGLLLSFAHRLCVTIPNDVVGSRYYHINDLGFTDFTRFFTCAEVLSSARINAGEFEVFISIEKIPRLNAIPKEYSRFSGVPVTLSEFQI